MEIRFQTHLTIAAAARFPLLHWMAQTPMHI